jgi:putative lipoic acid-binding regulatory protein
LTPQRSSCATASGGNYLGVTITITATSREQLDELYRTLSTHPMVKVVL